MQINNFTTSKIWKQSNKIRYDISNIVTLDNVDFLIREKEILCLQFFSINFSENLLKLIKSSIVNDKKVVFKYIDLTKDQFSLLKNWCNENKLQLIINDQWKAPILSVNGPLNNYIKSKCELLKRDYVKYINDNALKYKMFN